MTTNPNSRHPQHENARTRVSEQHKEPTGSPSEPGSNGTNTKNARTGALVTNDQPNKEPLRTVRNENRARTRVSKQPKETIIRTQPGEVTGAEREFLANGFGTMLHNVRTVQGFTQRQVSSLAGVTHSYISFLERGLRRPTPDVIEALARALLPADQQPYLIQQWTEAAGDSIRESWARQKLRAKSRYVRREVAGLRKHDVPKLQAQVTRLYNAGRTDLAEQLERTLEALTRQLDAHEQAAKDDLAALGDDPNEPVAMLPR